MTNKWSVCKKNMTSVLFGLKVTSQSLAHFDKLTKSAFTFSSSVRISGEVAIMELSSANNIVELLKLSQISFLYKK